MVTARVGCGGRGGRARVAGTSRQHVRGRVRRGLPPNARGRRAAVAVLHAGRGRAAAASGGKLRPGAHLAREELHCGAAVCPVPPRPQHGTPAVHARQARVGLHPQHELRSRSAVAARHAPYGGHRRPRARDRRSGFSSSATRLERGSTPLRPGDTCKYGSRPVRPQRSIGGTTSHDAETDAVVDRRAYCTGRPEAQRSPGAAWQRSRRATLLLYVSSHFTRCGCTCARIGTFHEHRWCHYCLV